MLTARVLQKGNLKVKQKETHASLGQPSTSGSGFSVTVTQSYDYARSLLRMLGNSVVVLGSMALRFYLLEVNLLTP